MSSVLHDRRARRRRTLLAGTAAALLLLAGGPEAGTAQEVPTPESVVGFELGSDHRLADYDQLTEYYRRLAGATDRMILREIGTTVEGRTMLLAIVSSAENLRDLDRYKEISRRLARAEGLSRERAEELAREGKAVVWIDAGMHSTEVAPAQAMPGYVHRMVTSEDPEVRRIREETIQLLMPVMNPDGLEIVTDWYRENRGTRFETAPLPRLYHEYVGHDNNRDWFMILMPETRAVADQLWHEWYPQIVYNHHQAGEPPPTIFVPPFADPMNPNIPPLVTRGVNTVGSAIAQRFDRKGLPGVVSRETYTMWWNGGMRTAPYFHNQIGILTETYHYRYATPKKYPADSLPERFSSGRSTERPSVLYPNPWEGGWWRLSDQVRYENVASAAVADVAADRRETWLLNSWRLGKRAVEKGEEGDSFAWIVPREQWDAGAAANMVSVLRRNGAEVHRAASSFRAGGRKYRAGSWVIYAAQAYRQVLMDLLEPQRYPDRREYPGGPIETPYDLAGWTLPMQMGVRTDRIDEPFETRTEPVEAVDLQPPAGEVSGSGPVWLLTPNRNSSYRAVNRLAVGGASVRRATSSFRAAGRRWPAGTFLVRADRGRVAAAADELRLDFVGAGSGPAVAARDVSSPRIGLYQSWDPTMDEGWTRWILENYEYRFDTLHDDAVRAGDLGQYDVILLPSQEWEEILNGHPPGTMPEKYVGGLGLEGAARLERWVRRGGTLVTLAEASEFAIHALGLPVRNAVADGPRGEFFIPGSLIRAEVDSSDPLAWGMQDTAAAYYVESMAFEPVPPAGEPNSARGPRVGERRLDTAVRYAGDDLLMSGWEKGAREHLGGKGALVRVPHGRGTVILAGFRTQFRAQPRGTFKLLFNSLLAGATEDLPFGEGDG